MVWDGSHWSKNNGAMTVGTLGSFSAAAYSKSQITLTWKNPAYDPASGICFSGVIIRYKTGSYPTSPTDGTLYMGTGSNTAASGSSSYTVGSLSANTKYYFRAWPYFTCSAGNYTINSTVVMTGNYLEATATTTATGQANITSSKNWTVPTNVRSIQAFLVGGGGNGATGTKSAYAGGGAGGYTKTTSWISVSPGQSIACTVGAGGGNTSIVINGTTYTANAGGKGTSGTSVATLGGTGGSGGGAPQGNGGSNGGNGEDATNVKDCLGGSGQGTTTRAFGSSSGTLYAGGGGGGGFQISSSYGYGAGSGGSGGGGAGNLWADGASGSANTGGGGGGGGSFNYSSSMKGGFSGGSGGSGIILIQY
jgi:hypothetical protein